MALLLVQVSAQVPELCVLFHESVQELSKKFLAKDRRHVYVTPTSYLELINSYKTLLGKKQNEVFMQTHFASSSSVEQICVAQAPCSCLPGK